MPWGTPHEPDRPAPVDVFEVPEGSLIAMRRRTPLSNEEAHRFRAAIAEACGHDRFALVGLGTDGALTVLKPDELVDVLRSALDHLDVDTAVELREGINAQVGTILERERKARRQTEAERVVELAREPLTDPDLAAEYLSCLGGFAGGPVIRKHWSEYGRRYVDAAHRNAIDDDERARVDEARRLLNAAHGAWSWGFEPGDPEWKQ